MKDYHKRVSKHVNKRVSKQRVSRERWSVKALRPSSLVIRSSHAEEEKGVWGLWNTPNEINSMQLQFR